jgi:hypothetical protein
MKHFAAAFHEWYASLQTTAPQTEVGRIATAAGFHVAQTGGNCLAWEKVRMDGRYCWICDGDNGLGEEADEPYLVAFYATDSEIVDSDEMPNLQIALEWCQRRIDDGFATAS